MDPNCYNQILTPPSAHSGRNRDSLDQVAFFQSSAVMFSWGCSPCSLSVLLLADRSGTGCDIQYAVPPEMLFSTALFHHNSYLSYLSTWLFSYDLSLTRRPSSSCSLHDFCIMFLCSAAVHCMIFALCSVNARGWSEVDLQFLEILKSGICLKFRSLTSH